MFRNLVVRSFLVCILRQQTMQCDVLKVFIGDLEV